MLLRSLLGHETAIRVRLTPDPRLFAWGLRFLRECTAARARRNTLVKLRLCQYSQAVMTELVSAEGIEYHAVTRGALYLYRDPRELEAGIKKMALLAEHGQRQEVLDAGRVARLDPAFEPVREKIAGAMRDLGDSSGDSRLFTESLARICRDKLGVTVRLGVRVTALRAEADRITAVVTSAGVFTADAYVLALGVGAPLVARTVGVRLGSTPPRATPRRSPSGRTVSRRPSRASTSSGSSAGRDSATACGSPPPPSSPATTGAGPRATSTTSCARARSLPHRGRLGAGQYRACLRPMTPDGPPVLGLGRHRNLFFNAGHGHMGWTMAFGTARIVTDLVAGRRPDHDPAGLGPRAVAGGL